MKRQLKFMTQIRLAMSVILLLVFMIGLIGTLTVNNVAKKKDAVYNEYTQGYEQFLMGYSYFEEAVSDSGAIVLAESSGQIDEYTANIEESLGLMEQNFTAAEGYFKDEELLQLLSRARTEAMKLKDSILAVIENFDKETDSIKETVSNGAEARESIENLMLELNTLIQEKMSERTEASNRYQFIAKVVLALMTIIGIVIGIVLETYMIRQIRLPLEVLSKASKKLAVGDVDIHLKKFKQNEFGDLTDDFGSVVNNIQRQADVASKVAVGDLTVDVHVNGSKDLLGNALEKLVEGNNTMMSNITEASMQVMTGADQVASASQSLAQGSTEQASAIEQVTASIADIAERTRVNAEQANEANSLVHNTKDSAIHGNGQMKEMITAMQAINESSENISKIIKVIDDIAFQTNILALNAAVEAARAGAHGKGFAVVAEEVRNLAGKSAAAASETAEMIEDSIRKVERGSQLAAETAEALNTIVEKVDHIVTIINSITIAFNEQATAVAQIDQAISQVSTVVQTNSATSEQCAAASEELSNQASKLKQLVSRYQLKSNYSVGGSGFGYHDPSENGNYRSSFGGDMGISTTPRNLSLGMNTGSGYSSQASVPNIPTTGTTSYQPNNENEKIIALGDGFGKY